MNSDREELNRDTTATEPADDGILDEADRAESSAPQTQPPASDGVLIHLQEQLRELRQRFDATDAQIADYLRDKTGTKTGAVNGEALTHLQQGVDRLLSQFDEMKSQLAASRDDASPKGPESEAGRESPGSQEVLQTLKQLAASQEELARKIVGTLGKRMSEELDLLRFQQIVHETLTTEWDRREAEAEAKARAEAEAEALALAESEMDIALQAIEEPEPESDPSVEAWSRAIWGAELTESEEFQPYLKELNRRLLEDDASVAALAGQLLVFRHASPEAKPQLLKDVGEAYYRSRIDAGDAEHPFERTLIRWLQTDCDRAGLPNTIEVVHVGERFDKSRHSNTTKGGAEVAEVFGWIVLTEGGRVYTRASVAAH